MNNDLISREALIKWIDDSVSQYGHTYSTDMLNMWGLFKDYLINNAPTVERPQGEYVDISKLRLMTVEECAGHTIDYAMGWKACIEWIKKGGAE